MYIDGQLETSTTTVGTDITFTTTHRIGGDNRGNPPGFHGRLDDLQIYSRALSPDEVVQIMDGLVDYRLASFPQPADEATDVPRDASLSWRPGEYAVNHDVYLGTVFDDVNDASVDHDRSVLTNQGQADTTYDPGILDLGQTYFWRVDEVNGAPDNSVFKGKVWSFVTEPVAYPIDGASISASASSATADNMGPENTINGSGLNELGEHSVETTDMWLSGAGDQDVWIQYEFDKVYKLHEMWVWNSNQLIESFVGLGVKEAAIEVSTDGAAWTPLENVPQFAQAPGAPTYTPNTTVDFGGVVAKYVKLSITGGWGPMGQYGLSEVRFFYIPLRAREPYPDPGETAAPVGAVLTWRAGREAAEHEVHLSTDQQAVINANALVTTVTEPVYDPMALDLNQSYYWRIDGVNTVETPTMLPGSVWHFTTQEYLVVDDFEGYDDDCKRIFFTWQDGLGHNGGTDVPDCDVVPYNGNGTGSIVGNATSPFAEQTLVHSGKQAMPLFYGNTSGAVTSEAKRSFATTQNWAQHSIKTLTVWFRGAAGNTGTLYVKINNTKVSYDGDAADIQLGWRAWNIDLSALNLNLESVTSLSIGVDGAGAEGTLLIDDLRLYPHDPQFITPTEPDGGGRVAWWTFDEASGSVAGDSSGQGNDATVAMGELQWVPGKIDGALGFDGVRHRLTLASPLTVGSSSNTVALWIKVPLAGNENLAAGERVGVILGNYPDTPNSNWELHDDGQMRMYWNGGQISAFGTTDLRDDTWHHVAWIRDKAANACTMYIDGHLEATHPSAGTDVTFGTNHTIGGDSRGTSSLHFHGLMDDLQVYSEALSTAEIAWLAGLRRPMHKPF